MKRIIFLILCLVAFLLSRPAQAQSRTVDNPKPEQVRKDTTTIQVQTGADGKKQVVQVRTVEIEATQDSAEFVQERFNRASDALLNLRSAAQILLTQDQARANFRKLAREFREVSGRTYQREYIRSGRAEAAVGIYLFRDFERPAGTVIALHYEGRDTLRECRYTVNPQDGTFRITSYPVNGRVFTISWYNPDMFELSGNLAQGITKAEFFLIGQVPDEVPKDRGRKFYGDLLLPLAAPRFQLVKLRETEQGRGEGPQNRRP
jgi:AraC-like DNA-binding protein